MVSTTAPLWGALENVTFDKTLIVDQKSLIISNEIMVDINIYFNFLLCGSVSFFGMITNIINTIVFYKMGVKDSMSVGLMALSVNDFLTSFTSLIRIIFFVWNMIVPDGRINPISINQVSFGWWRDIFFLCTAWCTTLISVERCVCVVLPFRVKDIFTKFRSFMCVIAIYFFNIGLHMPIFVNQWLGWTIIAVETANGTVFRERMITKTSGNRRLIQLYIDIANGAVSPMPSQALVLVCVIWMIYGLKASSRVRKANSLSEKNESQGKKQDNLSPKERRLIKIVLSLAIILTFCNIPRFLAIYAKQIFPEITSKNRNKNVFQLLWMLVNFACSFNASINIFIYVTINMSYRQQFMALFGKKIK